MNKIRKTKLRITFERFEGLLVRIGRLSKVTITRRITRAFILTTLVGIALVAGALFNNQAATLADETRFPSSLEVSIDDQVVNLITYQDTVIEAIDEAGIKVGENDLLSLPDDLKLIPGENYNLSISRMSNVTLSWSGYSISTAAEDMSISDLMSRSGFSELEADSESLMELTGADEGNLEGAEISYTNIEKSEYREFEAIPFTTVEVDDPNYYIGEKKVTTEGKNGSRAIIYEDTFEDGIFVSRTRIGTEIVENPVQQVISNGTKKKAVIAPISSRANSKVVGSFNSIKNLLNRNGQQTYQSFKDNGDGTITVDGQTFGYKDKQSRTVTMYDGLEVCLQSGCHSPAINHNTFSGIPAQRGVVATFGYRENGKFVGSNLPLGTVLFIEKYGLAVVGDIHGVSSNPSLIDLGYDPGEIRNGSVNIGKSGRTVYILSMP
jgi:uncharacterized protein YabE (DUF348 family)/3D (Asp-Asp-Asp) domain-containing protein